jgi:UDP-GlcNAc:undecaprenyl-phosphate GlcNAc-1-phosphate transferase
MNYILLSSCISFFITFFSIPIIIQVAKEKKLFDEPDRRKIHKIVIPTLGGVGIFAGFMMASLLCIPEPPAFFLQFFVAAAIVIFFLGLKDDILILSASKKFAGQIIAALILIKLGGFHINNMHGFLGIGQITDFSGTLLSLFTIIVITNSFNLIDGVDGLAGSLGILTTTIFGSYFIYINDYTFGVMAFALTGSLLSFLIYNFPPAKIFMGDTGSLLVGLVNSILVIQFINTVDSAGATLHIQSAPAIGFAILMIPLFDTLRVFGIRILNRRSPFSPDRNHIHHFLLDLGLSHKYTTLVCLSANIGFILLAFSLQFLGTTLLIGILLSTAIILISIIYYLRQNKVKVPSEKRYKEKEILASHKLLNLMPEHVEAE